MPVLDERLVRSLSWLRPGILDMVTVDVLRTGCSGTWLRRAYELQSPNWHCVRYPALSLKEWAVEQHTGDDERRLSVHDQKMEC